MKTCGAVLGTKLELPSCPHCRIDKPNLSPSQNVIHTANYGRSNPRTWATYVCSHCGGVVTAVAYGHADYNNPAVVAEFFPAIRHVEDELPAKAKSLLEQAHATLHAPALSIVGAAAAVDAMLKVRGFKEGSLFARIDEAAAQHVITEDMKKWAHQVRLDANDQRHADEAAPLPGEEDARRVLDFADALGMILFVLPARVTRGLQAVGGAG